MSIFLAGGKPMSLATPQLDVQAEPSFLRPMAAQAFLRQVAKRPATHSMSLDAVALSTGRFRALAQSPE